MEKKSFRVDPFGTVLHNEKTHKIYSRVGDWQTSKFARWAIMRYARQLGYKSKSWRSKPEFLNDVQWIVYQECNRKSKIVDYSYYLAFHWLKSLSQFGYIKDGQLLRLIIENSEDSIIDFLNSLESESVS